MGLANLELLEQRRLLSGSPTVSIADASIDEGNLGARRVAVVVELSARSSKSVSVNYATVNGTALAGSDYAATSGKLTFAPGETRKSIQVPVTGDRRPEGDESFDVKLGGTKNAKVARHLAAVAIVDDEPRIEITGVFGTYEGNDGVSVFNFDVNLSAAYDLPVAVDFATQDSTAIAGEDYLAASGTLTFAPGETSKTISVVILGDTTAEADEGFVVNFGGASPFASVGNNGSSAYGSIADDDGVDDGWVSNPWPVWSYYYW
jgi:hypothetical protein